MSIEEDNLFEEYCNEFVQTYDTLDPTQLGMADAKQQEFEMFLPGGGRSETSCAELPNSAGIPCQASSTSSSPVSVARSFDSLESLDDSRAIEPIEDFLFGGMEQCVDWQAMPMTTENTSFVGQSTAPPATAGAPVPISAAAVQQFFAPETLAAPVQQCFAPEKSSGISAPVQQCYAPVNISSISAPVQQYYTPQKISSISAPVQQYNAPGPYSMGAPVQQLYAPGTSSVGAAASQQFHVPQLAPQSVTTTPSPSPKRSKTGIRKKTLEELQKLSPEEKDRKEDQLNRNRQAATKSRQKKEKTKEMLEMRIAELELHMKRAKCTKCGQKMSVCIQRANCK